MREEILQQGVHQLVHTAVSDISDDAKHLLSQVLEHESNHTAQSMLASMLENVKIARAEGRAICQSPGYPTTYVFFGKEFPQGLEKFIEKELIDATEKGYLRPSIVHPLTRKNSGNNTGLGMPNIEYIHVPGQTYLDLYISFKGCGAELGNAMQIFTPAKLGKNYAGLKRFVLETAVNAGGKPCPPYAIGIGIGGQMDVCARLSRRVVSTRRWDDHNPDPQLDELEQELKEQINSLKLGAAGTGGDTIALGVKIALAATHTAIAPVAINFHCWTARRSGLRIYPDGSMEKLL
jgi:fumarate hydratase subunit alpha